jgi:hypothetical protein
VEAGLDVLGQRKPDSNKFMTKGCTSNKVEGTDQIKMFGIDFALTADGGDTKLIFGTSNNRLRFSGTILPRI